MAANERRAVRLGFWIGFYCVSTALIAPLYTLHTFSRMRNAEMKSLALLYTLLGISGAVMIGYRSSKALFVIGGDLAIRFLTTLYASILMFFHPLAKGHTATSHLIATLLLFTYGFIPTLLWALYFRYSKRVYLVLGGNLRLPERHP